MKSYYSLFNKDLMSLEQVLVIRSFRLMNKEKIRLYLKWQRKSWLQCRIYWIVWLKCWLILKLDNTSFWKNNPSIKFQLYSLYCFRASERIINHLNQFKLSANKARENFSGLSKRNYDINKAIQENKEILDELTKQTSELKSATEVEMKKLIKRDVFIIGDINKILSSK